ncbi:MAG TPA: gluconeogenesis factor YvcK family protein [Candidatus Eremiobacteraceae bacterium]|nr:gluconeogenesis factor YvcK family protein [Candidatus Eremiobacteraceae bacterium]
MFNGDGRAALTRMSRWLLPGMQVKRWLFVAVLGVFMFLDGFGRVLNSHDFNFHVNETIDRIVVQDAQLEPSTLQWIFMIVGVILIYLGLRQWMRSIVYALSPQDSQRLVEVIYERRQLDRGTRIVAIGGGTGLSTLLRGLKEYTANLTAIVTVTDDGGSSGRLRQELGVLPPGDIRNCLVALADSESMMTDLFQYRFNEGNGLVGHSFGNLFIAAMSGIAGDFDRAIKESSKVLNIKGRVLPSTLSNVALEATLADGSKVLGETAISRAGSRIRSLALTPSECKPLVETLEAIAAADVIVLGPGSLYTSIMPNLLVPGIAAAVVRAPALKVYVCNIMTQPGETDDMTASDHARALLGAATGRLFDYALVNVEQPHRLLRAYESEGAHQVAPDFDVIASLGVTPVPGRFVSEEQQVRHDRKKLAQAIVKLIVQRGGAAGLTAIHH